jgi:hypothetical protein
MIKNTDGDGELFSADINEQIQILNDAYVPTTRLVLKDTITNKGATLTHEAGHWMGLYHTFHGGCVKSKKKGDRVGDTPAVPSHNFGCPSEKTNTCRGQKGGLKRNDLVHNYMDYVDDNCMWEFTDGTLTADKWTNSCCFGGTLNWFIISLPLGAQFILFYYLFPGYYTVL